MKAAKVRVALADHSKFGNQEFAYVGPVTDIDILVTDSRVDTKYIGLLREAGVEVILADVRPSRNDSMQSEFAKPRARAASGH